VTPLTVVIPWADRPELARTLRHNAGEFRRLGAEVLVVCCGGDAGMLAACTNDVPGLEVDTVVLDAPFNKALALNVGAHRARGATLFFLDSDLLLDPGACETALARVSDERAVTLARVVESDARLGTPLPHLRTITHVLELETSNGKVVRVETNRRDVSGESRGAPGMVFVEKRHFELVGGMNSDLTGWGFEDVDLLIRLKLAAGLAVEPAGSAVHLTHGDDLRRIDGPSRSSNEALNFGMCMANYGLGHYLGTYQDDVATWGHG
jgi:hypothetical protein